MFHSFIVGFIVSVDKVLRASDKDVVVPAILIL